MNPDFSIKYSRLFLNGLSVLTIVTLILAVFSKLPGYPEEMVMYFCSDTLYLPSIYTDWFVNHSDMSGWHFNPAPNYFPDMGFYFLLMFITKNFITASFIFSFVQCLFLGFILVKLFKLIFPSGSSFYTLFIYTLLAVFLLEFFFFSENFINVFYLLINSYHTGGFLMSLVCTFFTFKYIIGKNPVWLFFLLLTGFLSVISDRLFLVLFSAPVIITSLLMIKKLGWKTVIPIVIVTIFFSWIGVKVFKSIDSYPYAMLQETKPADLSVILSQADAYFTQMYYYLANLGFMALTMYLFIISVFLMAYVFIRSVKNPEDKILSFYSLFSLVFSACVILAPMVVGKYQGADCFRYNVYPIYLGILNLAVFLMFWRREKDQNKILRFSLIGLNVLFFIIGLTQFNSKGIRDFFNYYPLKAQQIDILAEKEHLKYGVANYWDAKEMTLFSKRGVRVYAVFDDITKHEHVANDNWYFDNMFNFVVVTKFNDTTLYRSKLKDIQVISNLPKFRVVKTHPFTYSKETGGPPINTN